MTHYMLHVYEGYYLNYLNEIFDESLWQAKRHTLEGIVQSEGFREFWTESKLGYCAEFRVLVDSVVSEATTEATGFSFRF